MNFNDINWNEILTSKFWFGIDRARIHLSEIAFLYLGAGLTVLGIIALFFARFTSNQFLSRVAVRFAKIFIIIGLLEGLWYVLRTQYVQLLGTKFVAVLLLVWGLVWMYWPIKYLLRNYKEDMAKAQREASRDKYLNYKR